METTMSVRNQLVVTAVLGLAALAGAQTPGQGGMAAKESPPGTNGIAGKWQAEFDTQVGTQKYTFEFSVEGEKLTGTAIGRIEGAERAPEDPASVGIVRRPGSADEHLARFSRRARGDEGPPHLAHRFRRAHVAGLEERSPSPLPAALPREGILAPGAGGVGHECARRAVG